MNKSRLGKGLKGNKVRHSVYDTKIQMDQMDSVIDYVGSFADQTSLMKSIAIFLLLVLVSILTLFVTGVSIGLVAYGETNFSVINSVFSLVIILLLSVNLSKLILLYSLGFNILSAKDTFKLNRDKFSTMHLRDMNSKLYAMKKLKSRRWLDKGMTIRVAKYIVIPFVIGLLVAMGVFTWATERNVVRTAGMFETLQVWSLYSSFVMIMLIFWNGMRKTNLCLNNAIDSYTSKVSAGRKKMKKK